MNFTRSSHSQYSATPHRRIITTRVSRRRKYGTPVITNTPLLHWKFIYDRDKNKNNHNSSNTSVAGGGQTVARLRKVKNCAGAGGELSARKLAAWLWHLGSAAGGGSGGGAGGGLNLTCGSCDGSGLETGLVHVNTKFPSHLSGGEYGAENNDDLLQTAKFISSLKQGSVCEWTTEGATKWDLKCSGISNEVYCLYSHMKLLEGQVTAVSVVSAMQAEIVQAQLRIHELEADCQSSKKRSEHLLRKLDKKRASWQSREVQKSCAVIDDLRNELSRERKSHQRTEILNSKLVNELADMKLFAMQCRKDYEEEKKSRELMEEVCNELANRIAEGKAKVEALKMESIKVQEEAEEERNMLQMAEVWREERVHMKLIDAKLALEDKYSQMNKLIADLETFLRSRGGTLDVAALRKAEWIRQAAKSVNVEGIKEFSCEHSNSGDIYYIFEEVQQMEANEKAIELYNKHSPAIDISKIQATNSVVNNNNNQHLPYHSNGFTDDNYHLEENARGSETIGPDEDQGSSNALEGSEHSVNRLSQGSNARCNGRVCNKNAGQDSLNTPISEVCSLSAEQSMQKGSSISKLWRSGPSNSGCYKIASYDSDGRLSNVSISSVGTTPKRKSCEGRIGHQDFVGQRGTPDLVNPHFTRGMMGCIQWPRSIQKSSLKSKLLEARIEGQKSQLHNS